MKVLVIAVIGAIATLTIWRLRQQEEHATAHWDEPEEGIQYDVWPELVLRSTQNYR